MSENKEFMKKKTLFSGFMPVYRIPHIKHPLSDARSL
jgi:hypothetical protein